MKYGLDELDLDLDEEPHLPKKSNKASEKPGCATTENNSIPSSSQLVQTAGGFDPFGAGTDFSKEEISYEWVGRNTNRKDLNLNLMTRF